MATKVYGTSDDLIEFEGDVRGEVGHYSGDENSPGCLLICSDGTVLTAKYGKPQGGIWQINVVRKGALFASLNVCECEDADIYSDIAFFKDGLEWALAAHDWKRVE